MSTLTARYLGYKVQAQETDNGWLARLNGCPLGHFVKSNEALDYAMDEAYLTDHDIDMQAIERDRQRLAEVRAIEDEKSFGRRL